MAALQHTTGVHEGTVQRLARGEVGPAPRRRLRAVQSRPRNSRVQVQQVHPLVVAAAQQAVETGAYSRITWLDTSTALVT